MLRIIISVLWSLLYNNTLSHLSWDNIPFSLENNILLSGALHLFPMCVRCSVGFRLRTVVLILPIWSWVYRIDFVLPDLAWYSYSHIMSIYRFIISTFSCGFSFLALGNICFHPWEVIFVEYWKLCINMFRGNSWCYFVYINTRPANRWIVLNVMRIVLLKHI